MIYYLFLIPVCAVPLYHESNIFILFFIVLAGLTLGLRALFMRVKCEAAHSAPSRGRDENK